MTALGIVNTSRVTTTESTSSSPNVVKTELFPHAIHPWLVVIINLNDLQESRIWSSLITHGCSFILIMIDHRVWSINLINYFDHTVISTQLEWYTRVNNLIIVDHSRVFNYFDHDRSPNLITDFYQLLWSHSFINDSNFIISSMFDFDIIGLCLLYESPNLITDFDHLFRSQIASSIIMIIDHHLQAQPWFIWESSTNCLNTL